jgi:aminopeptidase C
MEIIQIHLFRELFQFGRIFFQFFEFEGFYDKLQKYNFFLKISKIFKSINQTMEVGKFEFFVVF